jgi:Lon protease-like protein
MASNVTYRGPADLPDVIPVFPLPGALLLPRGQLPLNIFETRYVAMIDDAMKGARLIGMIQPDEAKATSPMQPSLYSVGCVGRITQLAETGDGRYLITLTGIARFQIRDEQIVPTLYRQCRVDFTPFTADFTPSEGADVDRDALMKTLANYLDANRIEADWAGIREAPIEALVNGLSMMSPYGPREKQALLEAADLKARADLLIAVTEFALAERGDDGEKSLQ